MIRMVAGFVGRLVEREARAASRVAWDSARSATYAPFVVSTILMLTHRLDEQHWTAVTLATIAADSAKNAASAFMDGVGGVVGKVTALWSGEPDEDD